MDDYKIIITVSGTDKVGIVSSVSTVLAKNKVNIEDIKQTKNILIEEGNKLEVEIWVQKKGIFEKMHTV